MRGHAAQAAASPAISAQLIVLAAGKGTRMMGLTESTPKALLPILENRCILEINLRNVLASKAATKVHVVGGHAWARLRTHLERYADCGIPVHGILNADYDLAGPCRSIQLALSNAKSCERITIANGDTIFSSAAFRRLKMKRPGLFLLGSRVRCSEADDLLIACDPGGRIRSASKAGVDGGAAIISSGMFAAVGAEARDMLSAAVIAVLKRERDRGRQLPWHDLLGHLSASGTPAQLLLINRSAWYEFDSISCIARFQSQHHGSFLRVKRFRANVTDEAFGHYAV